jgi:outer membrane protein TolC
MKHWIFAGALASAAAIGFSAQAQSTPGADVESLLAMARERNPELASSLREADAASERVEPAGALPDPRLRTELLDVTKGGSQDPTLLPARVGSARYTFIQDIPWMGKRDLKRGAAQSEADSVKSRAEAAWNEIAFKVKSTYARLLYLSQAQALTRESLDLSTRLEQVAQSRYAGGLAAQQDVIRSQVEKTNLRAELIAWDAEMRLQRARMNALLGRPSNADLAPPKQMRPAPDPSRLAFDALLERARQHSPALQADAAKLRATEQSRDLTYKNRYPDFTVGVAPNQTQNSFKQWDLMLEVSIPLQQSTRRSQERESESMVEAARSRREATENQLSLELSESVSALLAATQMETLTSDALLPQAELTFKSALSGYEAGKVDFATLLDAQRQIRQAQQTLIKAQSESQTRLADIERLIGEDL